MIWFGNLNRIATVEGPDGFGPLPERARMRRALEWAAERAPGLRGPALLDALQASGWVDRGTAARLLPEFRAFNADRHFGDHLRRISFRGNSAAAEFRRGIGCIMTELTAHAAEAHVGPMAAVRFRSGEHEGLVLAHPEVRFTINGPMKDAVLAAVEEMPDSLVIVAANFERSAQDQLSGLLARTGVPGTLITLNLLLGLRAVALRYQPSVQRVLDLFGAGRPIRSVDLGLLGNRD